MKIRIETDPSITEDEVIILCGKISDSILKMEHALNDLCISDTNFIFYKGDTEFYLPLDSILFFEKEYFLGRGLSCDRRLHPDHRARIFSGDQHF